jgi:hypothetical protein
MSTLLKGSSQCWGRLSEHEIECYSRPCVHPRHRTVLGVNCEAYASSLPSTFNQHPLDIAVFILRLVGLPVEKVCQTANAPEVVFRCELAGSQLASMP